MVTMIGNCPDCGGPLRAAEGVANVSCPLCGQTFHVRGQRSSEPRRKVAPQAERPSLASGRCPKCRQPWRAAEPGRYPCPGRCGATIEVRRGQPARVQLPVKESGFIPWENLDDGVRSVLLAGRARARRGMGPGDAVAAALKKVGVRPCPKCEKRRAVLNRLGWKVVGGGVAALIVGLAAVTVLAVK